MKQHNFLMSAGVKLCVCLHWPPCKTHLHIPIQGTDTVVPVQVITVRTVVLEGI